jgi:hypothetical protein
MHRVAAGQQRRHLRIELVDHERLIGAVITHRAFRPGAAAIPDFTLGIATTHEQHVLGLAPADLAARRQHQQRIRLRKAAEVLEIAVLAELVVGIARTDHFARRGHDGDAILADRPHQRRTTRGVFLQGLGMAAHGGALRGQCSCCGWLGSRVGRGCSSMKISCAPTRTYSNSSV